MALIKCPECGADISEKASVCPKCGCPLNIIKQLIFDKKIKRKKIMVRVFVAIFSAIFILVTGGFVVSYNFKPYNIAVRMIKKDFGKNVKIQEVYYNSDEKGCIVYFTHKGNTDIATVHLDEKTVGYQSILDEYTSKSNSTKNDNDKQKYASDVVDYMNLYDIMWEFNLILYGLESGWEKIK